MPVPCASQIPQSRLPAAFQSYKPEWIRSEERVGKVFGVMVVNKHGEVLLVKDRRTEKWSFPKGKCKRGERELDCALRELKEETGLELPSSLQPISTKELRGGTYYLFALEEIPTETTLAPHNSWEIAEVRWWSLTALPTGMSGNIDVSLFRTCMKGLKKKVDLPITEEPVALNYLESKACRRRMGFLRGALSERGEVSPKYVPESPPARNDDRWSGLNVR